MDTSAYIYLDGHTVPGRFLFGYGEAERGAMRVGVDTEVPFVFSKPSEGVYHNGLHKYALTPFQLMRRTPRTTTPMVKQGSSS